MNLWSAVLFLFDSFLLFKGFGAVERRFLWLLDWRETVRYHAGEDTCEQIGEEEDFSKCADDAFCFIHGFLPIEQGDAGPGDQRSRQKEDPGEHTEDLAAVNFGKLIVDEDFRNQTQLADGG